MAPYTVQERNDWMMAMLLSLDNAIRTNRPVPTGRSGKLRELTIKGNLQRVDTNGDGLLNLFAADARVFVDEGKTTGYFRLSWCTDLILDSGTAYYEGDTLITILEGTKFVKVHGKKVDTGRMRVQIQKARNGMIEMTLIYPDGRMVTPDDRVLVVAVK